MRKTRVLFKSLLRHTLIHFDARRYPGQQRQISLQRSNASASENGRWTHAERKQKSCVPQSDKRDQSAPVSNQRVYMHIWSWHLVPDPPDQRHQETILKAKINHSPPQAKIDHSLPPPILGIQYTSDGYRLVYRFKPPVYDQITLLKWC